MLPILIRSVFKYISIIGIYYPIRQAVPVVDSPITKVKFTQIVLISLTNDIFPRNFVRYFDSVNAYAVLRAYKHRPTM